MIGSLLDDVTMDKERVEGSIKILLELYRLNSHEVSLSRKQVDPSNLYVAAVEECNLGTAKKIMKKKYLNKLPAPVTVMKFKGKHYLFMGSNRSVIFTLKGEKPDCLVVEVPDTMKEPKLVTDAKQTLKEIIS